MQVLCSVPDVQATLKELQRVVRPGGRILFVEHVLSPQPGFLRTLQQLLNPLQQLLLDGCHTTRDTGAAGLYTLPSWPAPASVSHVANAVVAHMLNMSTAPVSGSTHARAAAMLCPGQTFFRRDAAMRFTAFMCCSDALQASSGRRWQLYIARCRESDTPPYFHPPHRAC